jgi:hypothetical protein
MAREVKSRALMLEPLLHGVQVRHPLVSGVLSILFLLECSSLSKTATQISVLRKTLASVTVPPPPGPQSALQVGSSISRSTTPEPDVDPESLAVASPEPSETAILVALFGWSPAPLPPPTPRLSSHHRTASASVVALSRSASVSSFRSFRDRDESRATTPSASRAGTPAPLTSGSGLGMGGGSAISGGGTKPENAMLHCQLCQRRVGLWAFAPKGLPPPAFPPSEASGTTTTPATDGPRSARAASQSQRQLDLLKEHRAYCPYLVRSTVIPSLPSASAPDAAQAQEDTLEGWRAVLAVLSRYGLGQRARTRRVPSSISAALRAGAEEVAEEPMEVDSVNAMVADVKKRGSRDLLKYVKSLLG